MAIQTLPVDEEIDEIPAAPEADTPPVISPLAVNSIGDLLDPDARLATHFTGPVISGSKEGGVSGIALLHKRARLTFDKGSFSIPIKFPASSILTQLVIQQQQVYNGLTPKINFGTTLNGLDIYSFDATQAVSQYFQNVVTLLTTSWTIYLSQALGAGNTAGKCTVLVFYSVPAKVIWS